MHLAHPFSITTRQIIVDRDYVDTSTRKGVEIARQCCNKRLAFASLHLGDLALVKNHTADQLNIKVTHSKDTLCRLSNYCEGLRKDFIQDRTLVS